MRSTLYRIGGMLMVSAALAACQTAKKEPAPVISWDRPNTSADAMRADFGLCGGSFDAAGNMIVATGALDAIDGCMRSKGYARLN